MRQGDLFKKDGIEQVQANERRDWMLRAYSILYELMDSGQEFTAEHARDLARFKKIGQPHHPNAWGALFNTFARAGRIEKVGYKKNHIPSAHSRIVTVWRASP